MPNQLSQTKRRQSLAEHVAVLAALAQIARQEDTTVMDLLREAARTIVRQRPKSPAQFEVLRRVVWQQAPRMPEKFRTASQLARFKRAQREFDRVVMDLQLAAPEEIQDRNSIVARSHPVRLINFDRAHASR
jgi:hypothetical protein